MLKLQGKTIMKKKNKNKKGKKNQKIAGKNLKKTLPVQKKASSNEEGSLKYSANLFQNYLKSSDNECSDEEMEDSDEDIGEREKVYKKKATENGVNGKRKQKGSSTRNVVGKKDSENEESSESDEDDDIEFDEEENIESDNEDVESDNEDIESDNEEHGNGIGDDDSDSDFPLVDDYGVEEGKMNGKNHSGEDSEEASEDDENEEVSEGEEASENDGSENDASEEEASENDASEEEASEDEAGSDAEEASKDGRVSKNKEDKSEESDLEFEEEDEESESLAHKMSLQKLKDTDPEFYKFLKDNDKKLLNFNVSDGEEDSDKEESDGEEEDQRHIPSGELEKDSDESDFEPEDGVVNEKVVTLKMLKQWRVDLEKDKTNKTIGCLIRAFHAALKRVSTEKEEDEAPAQYKVDGSSVFNAIIQLCVLELGPAVRRLLGLSSGSQPAHKAKKFTKVKTLLRGYFTDLLKLLGCVTSSNILTVLLKHLHYMSSLLTSFPHIVKPFLKKLVSLWGKADESVRVVAFLVILRITHSQHATLLDTVLKMMHLSYVQNCKFVSIGSLPGINFMRRSLVEMFALDVNVSYQHVFMYIRQLAIQLRNAITANKKENTQAVYNWQFINSLRLWGNLLSATYNKPQLQPLVYPFIQVCLGTIKLVPTAQYFPLRFHVVQILIDLSKETEVFVNVLPFLLEVLTTYDFNKSHQKVSMKPLHFTCLLRLSKSQLSENGFKDSVIDMIYGQLLQYLAIRSHSLAFPDLSLVCTMQIKQFIKKCKKSNYCSKMKQIVEKIEQNSACIEKHRKTIAFSISDFKQIDCLETKIKNEGTPLYAYYEMWSKFNLSKRKRQNVDNKELGNYKLPTLKKLPGAKEKSKKSGDGDEKVTLFPSDSESDEEASGEKKGKRNRGKRGGKKSKKMVNMDDGDMDIDGNDIVEDLDVQNW